MGLATVFILQVVLIIKIDWKAKAQEVTKKKIFHN